VRTPWGELIAVNANTGDIAWRVPLGDFLSSRQRHPQPVSAVRPAGNLVFITRPSTAGAFTRDAQRQGAVVGFGAPASIPSSAWVATAAVVACRRAW
jgi:hypothetical protein